MPEVSRNTASGDPGPNFKTHVDGLFRVRVMCLDTVSCLVSATCYFNGSSCWLDLKNRHCMYTHQVTPGSHITDRAG